MVPPRAGSGGLSGLAAGGGRRSRRLRRRALPPGGLACEWALSAQGPRNRRKRARAGGRAPVRVMWRQSGRNADQSRAGRPPVCVCVRACVRVRVWVCVSLGRCVPPSDLLWSTKRCGLLSSDVLAHCHHTTRGSVDDLSIGILMVRPSANPWLGAESGPLLPIALVQRFVSTT